MSGQPRVSKSGYDVTTMSADQRRSAAEAEGLSDFQKWVRLALRHLGEYFATACASLISVRGSARTACWRQPEARGMKRRQVSDAGLADVAVRNPTM